MSLRDHLRNMKRFQNITSADMIGLLKVGWYHDSILTFLYLEGHDSFISNKSKFSTVSIFSSSPKSQVGFQVYDPRETATMPNLSQSTLMDQIDYDLDGLRMNESKLGSNSLSAVLKRLVTKPASGRADLAQAFGLNGKDIGITCSSAGRENSASSPFRKLVRRDFRNLNSYWHKSKAKADGEGRNKAKKEIWSSFDAGGAGAKGKLMDYAVLMEKRNFEW